MVVKMTYKLVVQTYCYYIFFYLKIINDFIYFVLGQENGQTCYFLLIMICQLLFFRSRSRECF